jgi:peptide/nickel transport system substrate-binding protein
MTRSLRIATRYSCIALVALLLCACTRSAQHWGTPGEARVAIRIDPRTLVPMFSLDQRQIDIAQIYAEPLVSLTSDNKPYPLLCTVVPNVENGGISRDARTITYHLRRGIRFADGVEFTSADVAYTYRVIVDPKNPSTESAAYRRVTRIETPDPYTVVMHLSAPWVNAPHALFATADFIYGILPAHAFHGSTDITHSDWAQHPFGTGPFRVTAWNRGDSVIFEPNPYSFQHPKLKRIVMKVVPDNNAAFVGLQNRSFDMVELSEPQVERARALPGVTVIRIPRNETEFAHFDVESPLVRDPAVREAIQQAIDRNAIARTAYHGLSPPATTEVPPMFSEHDASIQPPAYDRDAARAFFEKHPLDHPLTIIVDNSTVNERTVATIILSQLLAAGIPAQLRALPSDMIYAPDGPYYGGRFDLEMGGFYGGMDAEQSEYYLCAYAAPHGSNTARYCNPAYEAAYRIQAISGDPRIRQETYASMQRLIADGHVIIPFVYLTEYIAVNSSLRNVKPDMLYNFGNIAEWEMR